MSFFPIKTAVGRELDTALILENRAKSMNLDIRSVIIPPRTRGYVIVEASSYYVVNVAIKDLKYVKGRAGRRMTEEDVMKLIKVEPVVTKINIGDIVEIIGGPFKGMKAKVEAKDEEKNEVILSLLEASYPLQITLSADLVKPVRR